MNSNDKYNEDAALREINECVMSKNLSAIGEILEKIKNSSSITGHSNPKNYIVGRMNKNIYLSALEYILLNNNKFKINFADLDLFLLRQSSEDGAIDISSFMQKNITNGKIKVSEKEIGNLLKSIFFAASHGHSESAIDVVQVVEYLIGQYPKYFEDRMGNYNTEKHTSLSGGDVINKLAWALFDKTGPERSAILSSFNRVLFYKFKDGKKLITLFDNLWAQSICLELVKTKNLNISEIEKKEMFIDVINELGQEQLSQLHQTLIFNYAKALDYKDIVLSLIDKKRLERAIDANAHSAGQTKISDYKI